MAAAQLVAVHVVVRAGVQTGRGWRAERRAATGVVVSFAPEWLLPHGRVWSGGRWSRASFLGFGGVGVLGTILRFFHIYPQ